MSIELVNNVLIYARINFFNSILLEPLPRESHFIMPEPACWTSPFTYSLLRTDLRSYFIVTLCLKDGGDTERLRLKYNKQEWCNKLLKQSHFLSTQEVFKFDYIQ